MYIKHKNFIISLPQKQDFANLIKCMLPSGQIVSRRWVSGVQMDERRAERRSCMLTLHRQTTGSIILSQLERGQLSLFSFSHSCPTVTKHQQNISCH